VNWIKVQFQHLPRDLAGDLRTILSQAAGRLVGRLELDQKSHLVSASGRDLGQI